MPFLLLLLMSYFPFAALAIELDITGQNFEIREFERNLSGLNLSNFSNTQNCNNSKKYRKPHLPPANFRTDGSFVKKKCASVPNGTSLFVDYEREVLCKKIKIFPDHKMLLKRRYVLEKKDGTASVSLFLHIHNSKKNWNSENESLTRMNLQCAADFFASQGLSMTIYYSMNGKYSSEKAKLLSKSKSAYWSAVDLAEMNSMNMKDRVTDNHTEIIRQDEDCGGIANHLARLMGLRAYERDSQCPHLPEHSLYSVVSNPYNYPFVRLFQSEIQAIIEPLCP